jgi:hypothetical protein
MDSTYFHHWSGNVVHVTSVVRSVFGWEPAENGEPKDEHSSQVKVYHRLEGYIIRSTGEHICTSIVVDETIAENYGPTMTVYM